MIENISTLEQKSLWGDKNMRSVYQIISSIFAISFFALLLTNSVAFAHAPSGIDLEYDKAEESLTVDITHSVNDPGDHFIEKVEIRKNDELVQTKDYDSQPTQSSFTYTFSVSAEAGDTLQAKAYCNRFGDLQGSIEISEETDGPNGGEEGDNLPLMLGIAFTAIAIAAVAIYLYSRRS